MSEHPQEKKRKRFVRKLKHKFRLVLLNDETFENRFSIVLSPLNVFVWGGALLILLILLVSSVIAFTPLREFIPGYSDVTVRKTATYAALKADSLENDLMMKNRFIENLKAVFSGDTSISALSSEDLKKIDLKNVSYDRSVDDSLLREQIEKEDKYNIQISNKDNTVRIRDFFFFSPVKGVITEGFSMEKDHFGIDIAAPENEAIKATLDGTIIFAGWTSETGHVIQIQHKNNLVSVYKHNSVLLKKLGDRVKSGEVIAIIGDSGELTSGPHLHFELWFNGKAIDPQNFILF